MVSQPFTYVGAPSTWRNGIFWQGLIDLVESFAWGERESDLGTPYREQHAVFRIRRPERM